jgi:hypothetical protein
MAIGVLGLSSPAHIRKNFACIRDSRSVLAGARYRTGATVHDDDVRQLIGGPPRIALEDIVRHPGLPEARKVYLDRFLAVYGGDPFLVRLLIETGRFFIFHIVALLEAAQDPERRDTWLTVGHLKEQMSTLGLGSGRHVDQLVGRLCAVGFMELRPAERDRRVRILRGTEKLWAHHRDWLAAHFVHLAHLFPEYDYGPILRRDAEVHFRFLRTGIVFLPFAMKLMFANRDIVLFFERAGGYMVLAALLQAAMAAGDETHTAVPYGDVGDRFGISRTHVRRLLTDAEAAGLVKLHTRGGHRVELLPRLWVSHDRSMATGMYLHDMVYVKAAGSSHSSAARGNVLRLA